jgi:fucose permease
MLFAIGITFSMAGVITKPVADHFAVDTALVGYSFTLFTVGYSAAIFGNGLLLEKIDLRKETLAACGLAALSILGATAWPALSAFSFFIFIYGVSLGILCSISYYLVVNMYGEAARAAKLNILNFFFSVGAIAAPILAGLALRQGVSWQWLYLATLLLLVGVAGVAWVQRRFAVRYNRPAVEAATYNDVWGRRIYISGLALFCYVVSEMIFGYWVVIYMIEVRGIDVALAGASLSIFWTFMAGGRLITGVVVARMNVITFLTVNSALAFAAFAAMLLTADAYVAVALVALMGLGYSGLYATIVSYGTLQLRRPSSRLTTFFLTIGSAGGILSFILSSFLKQNYGITFTLAVAAALMGAVVVLVFLAGRK